MKPGGAVVDLPLRRVFPMTDSSARGTSDGVPCFLRKLSVSLIPGLYELGLS